MSLRRLSPRIRHPLRATLIALVVLGAVGFAVARCDVDGGLLNPDSAASADHRDDRRRASDAAYRRHHANDVYYDVVDFVGSIDAGLTAVDAAAKQSPPDTPLPLQQAADQARDYLGRLARSARSAASRIDATPPPRWYRALAPDTSPGYWIDQHASARSAFTTFADTVESTAKSLDDPTVLADTTRSRAISDRVDDAARRLGDDMSALMKRIAIPTEATRHEIERRGYFADADHPERTR
ncbi:hypothetical protein [Gordonia sp. (in: high G+C Gram-positive bacteria)]|uniref:hypothetical protein n=1 Tax=Gordonia sp. (in: high G+C Gram-positive bacteria) TaxID=84139 RepID=UPI0026139D5B|nr:hypothetical protein [Gordonia sp. (in: high G+C Gram-positive bacteria)]